MLLNKKAVMAAALDQPANRPGTVLVRFWTKHPDVQLPACLADLADEEALNLRYSYRYELPLMVEDDGVRAVLSRGGQNYDTFVPWDAVGVIMEDATGAHCVWPVRTNEDQERGTDTPAPAKKDKAASRGHLRLISKLEDPVND